MKIRSGYVSNSSSSSFILLDKGDITQAVSTWNELDLGKLDDYCALLDYGPEESIKHRFEEIVSAMGLDVRNELWRFLSSVLFYLDSLRKAIEIGGDGDHYRDMLEEYLDDIARLDKSGPIMAGFKGQICHLLYGGKKPVDGKFYQYGDNTLLDAGVDEIINAHPNACACEFSSDSGTKEEIFIRCYGLYPLAWMLRNKGVRLLVVDNS